MEGDDILLADMEIKVEPKRDEWMTTLPPERKVRTSFVPLTIIVVIFPDFLIFNLVED